MGDTIKVVGLGMDIPLRYIPLPRISDLNLP